MAKSEQVSADGDLNRGFINIINILISTRSMHAKSNFSNEVNKLAQIVVVVIGLAPPSIGLIITLNFFVIWTEKRPATAPLTNDFSIHISIP